MIELQKSSNETDLIRFRRYLGEQYKKEEEVQIIQDGGINTLHKSLPIITIYILGYFLSRTLPAVMVINRRYKDLLKDIEIEERNDFIECLTHDSYIIQIPGLQLEMKNQLEYVLSVFKQERFIDHSHRLKDYQYEINNNLLKMILKRLSQAAADKKVLHQLEVEELAYRDYDCRIGRLYRELEKRDKTIEAKEKTIEEKDKVLEEKEKALQEKEKTLWEKDRLIAELLKNKNQKEPPKK